MRSPRFDEGQSDDFDHEPDVEDCVGIACFDVRFPPDGGDSGGSPELVGSPWELGVGGSNDPRSP